MKYWEESQDDVRKVRPDVEMARSLLKMIEVRMKALETLDRKEFSSLIVEGYYEVIKEAITALMAIDGYKTLSHEVLIGYMKEFCPQFVDNEILFADDLRKLRNNVAYKGFFVPHDFILRNEKRMRVIVMKLLQILKEKLNS